MRSADLDAASAGEHIGRRTDIRGGNTPPEPGRRQLRAMQEELARVTRMLEMGQMAASIAHEISQPPSGITASANAGLSWLSRPTPDLDEARVALKSIVSSDVVPAR